MKKPILLDWVDHFYGVVKVKPCCSGCMYNFYVRKPLLGLGKVARDTLLMPPDLLKRSHNIWEG